MNDYYGDFWSITSIHSDTFQLGVHRASKSWRFDVIKLVLGFRTLWLSGSLVYGSPVLELSGFLNIWLWWL